MTRTQIQLPDDIHMRARMLCQKKEISMAELARRGIEYMLSVYGDGQKDWTPPKPRSLGWKGLSESELKEAAQKSLLEVEVSKNGKA
jgi:hypothetical protein